MASGRLYVGHLSHRARENDVEEFFGRYGRIREILLKNGFGFVEFDDPRDAEEAVYRCNGKELRGERVIVEMTKRPPRGRDVYRSMGSRPAYPPGGGGGGRSGFRSPTRNPAYQYSQTKYKLIVKNLSSRLSWQDLKDIFRSVGEVMYADAHRERRNEGVVCFACHSDMKKALENLDGKEYNGRKLELIEASGSRSRSRSRRSSRSRSYSRSRSRSSRRSRSRRSSRSRSRSRSAGSRSKSRSRSRDNKKSSSRGRSTDKKVNGDHRSASRSASPHDRSRSRSAAKDKRRSTSRSASPAAANGRDNDAAD